MTVLRPVSSAPAAYIGSIRGPREPPAFTATVDPRTSRTITITELDPVALRRSRRRTLRLPLEFTLRGLRRPERARSPMRRRPHSRPYRVQGATLTFQSRYPLDQPAYRIVIALDPLPGRRKSLDVNEHRAGLDPSSDPRGSHRRSAPSFLRPGFFPRTCCGFTSTSRRPMGRGEAYTHIHLMDSAGKPIADAFLEIDEELWSSDGRRFTLLFDPAGSSGGSNPSRSSVRSLREGNRYTLQIDRQWRDARGRPLGRDHRVDFRVAGPDRNPPSPGDWTIRPPGLVRETLSNRIS